MFAMKRPLSQRKKQKQTQLLVLNIMKTTERRVSVPRIKITERRVLVPRIKITENRVSVHKRIATERGVSVLRRKTTKKEVSVLKVREIERMVLVLDQPMRRTKVKVVSALNQVRAMSKA